MKETPKQFIAKVEKRRETLKKKYRALRNCDVPAAQAARLMHRSSAFIKQYFETLKANEKC